MASDLINSLKQRIEDDIDGLTVTPEGLSAVTDCRFGELTLQLEYDEEAQSLRVAAAVPPPAGAGLEFLLWCMHVNTQYWDVKFGLDDDGQLLVHADVDADQQSDLSVLSAAVLDRVETVFELIDDDLTEWILSRGLGTPAQRERWMARKPTRSAED
jgi:hypothetical protein